VKKLTVFLLTIVAFAVVSISFTSCRESDDTYNPRKKILYIHEKEDGEAEHLKEEWDWGMSEDRLHCIYFYNDIELEGKDLFVYKEDRIFQIKDFLGYYSEYFYADEKLERIEYYSPIDDLLAKITFQYDKKKISKITVYNYEMDKNVIGMIERGFMGKLLPERGMKIVAEKLANPTKETIVFNLAYEGDNILSITTDEYVVTYSNYDTRSNPWFKFHPFSTYQVELYLHIFSKNNPGKSIFKEGVNTITTTYVYTYDDDFPVTIQSNTVSSEGSSTTINRIVYK